jgi:hypothetical protein
MVALSHAKSLSQAETNGRFAEPEVSQADN